MTSPSQRAGTPPSWPGPARSPRDDEEVRSSGWVRSRARARGRRRRRIDAGIPLREPYPDGLPDVARRRTLGIADGRLAALEAAPAGPVPVRGVAVLVPGFTGSKEDFIPLLSPVAAAG